MNTAPFEKRKAAFYLLLWRDFPALVDVGLHQAMFRKMRQGVFEGDRTAVLKRHSQIQATAKGLRRSKIVSEFDNQLVTYIVPTIEFAAGFAIETCTWADFEQRTLAAAQNKTSHTYDKLVVAIGTRENESTVESSVEDDGEFQVADYPTYADDAESDEEEKEESEEDEEETDACIHVTYVREREPGFAKNPRSGKLDFPIHLDRKFFYLRLGIGFEDLHAGKSLLEVKSMKAMYKNCIKVKKYMDRKLNDNPALGESSEWTDMLQTGPPFVFPPQ